MNAAKLLNDIVLPHLLEHEGFKEALVQAVSQIPITDIQSMRQELPTGKNLTIGTLPEATNNIFANMHSKMRVTLKDAVYAYAKSSEQE